MQSLLPLILFGLIVTVFSLPAASADDRGDRDRSKAGAGASTEGGASLGGTGIDSGVANPRGGDDPDKRLKLQRKPRPVEEKQPPERGNASSGATARGSAELSEEVDKQDEEFRRKQDAARRK